jgi:hypothetical protein
MTHSSGPTAAELALLLRALGSSNVARGATGTTTVTPATGGTTAAGGSLATGGPLAGLTAQEDRLLLMFLRMEAHRGHHHLHPVTTNATGSGTTTPGAGSPAVATIPATTTTPATRATTTTTGAGKPDETLRLLMLLHETAAAPLPGRGTGTTGQTGGR